jgi:hypothetical protein
VLSALLAAAIVQSGCAATPVHYEPSKFPSLSDTPWVVGKPVSAGLLGAVTSYPRTLRDPRVNRTDGLVLWRVATIAWNRPGSVRARRLDGPGSFSKAPDVGSIATTLRFPSSGCWRLTLWNRSGFGSKIASVVARVVEAPRRPPCGATLLQNGWVFARPRSSGIKGGWPWQSTGPARLATHGHDGDKNMKVPWWIKGGGRSLELDGTRLDAVGTFHQSFAEALSPKGIYPSTVDIPVAGCWLLRLRTARHAGVLVVRAYDGG